MNILNKPLYFCSECKKEMDDLHELLFIDEFSQKGFCSEECIEDFYFPIIKYFEAVERKLRGKHNLLEENLPNETISTVLLEETLGDPFEVYRQGNELNDFFYHFIRHYTDFSVVITAAVYSYEASFVFLTLKTNSEKLINEFRHGELLKDWNVEKEEALKLNLKNENAIANVNEDEDFIFMQQLENKKSKILADVLSKIKESDISFEDYSAFESCFPETMEFPDEVFERKDNEGDVLCTYIKYFGQGSNKEDCYFYIIICLRRKLNGVLDNNSIYPILGMPTNDIEMCQEFRLGTRLTGPIQN